MFFFSSFSIQTTKISKLCVTGWITSQRSSKAESVSCDGVILRQNILIIPFLEMYHYYAGRSTALHLRLMLLMAREQVWSHPVVEVNSTANVPLRILWTERLSSSNCIDVWRQNMKTLCESNPPFPGAFPLHGTVMPNCDVLSVLTWASSTGPVSI